MIRELLTTAAIAGAAIGTAPVAGADNGRYEGDVPGMNYDASLGAPCDNYERFIFGRGTSGQAEACHFPPPNQFPAATTGYWVISYPLYGVQQAGAPARVRRRRRRHRTACRCCVWERRDGKPGGSPGPGSSRPKDDRLT
ncbi:hypothetical protein NIIDMKKI_33840 [Mycobacterium kansasii]|uniref:Uncharacterized protein n=1 Tax=Mycobacterium kansasii TaxID=1768 RepID=A0A1V3X4J3_MYCKA|nr:hypothetical protein I547_5627 [Mycobacterium kansasii 824]OOK74183.1 hypothetical protein BZL30_4868 [Mycobacterium kansasii]BCI88178.1 hypothetical protein NIIDMKKI_33840 [Mycobacterium kansasii]